MHVNGNYMHKLASCLLNQSIARVYRAWQKRRSFLKTSLASPSLLRLFAETMNTKYTTTGIAVNQNPFFRLQKQRMDVHRNFLLL